MPIIPSILTSQHSRSVNELQTNPDIILLTLGKVSEVVFMNKFEYKSRMLSTIMNESKHFPDVEFEGVSILEESVNSHLVKVLYKNTIDKKVLNFLKIVDFEHPYLHRLLEIHK